jgi:dTMP kinase
MKIIPGGFYMTLDGVDGCGKTTQFNLIRDRLSQEYDVVPIREPGGTSGGEHIRSLLLSSNCGFSPESELFLFSAGRRDIFEKIVLPATRDGKLVLGDRSCDASEAYQGYGGGGDLEVIKYVSQIATCGKKPNLTFFLDVEPKQAKLSDDLDDIERRGLEYQQRVRQGYLEIAKRDSSRCVVLPFINGGAQQTHEEIYRITKKRIDEVFKQ